MTQGWDDFIVFIFDPHCPEKAQPETAKNRLDQAAGTERSNIAGRGWSARSRII
jgi:hypothetical protein